MEYIYKENKKAAPVFVLLHGTGGDETDLISFARLLNPTFNILGIRGNVKENGMNRYFKRHEEGRYDWDDLHFRGEELYKFIVERSEEYKFKLEDVILIGFSNGANIAVEMILQYPHSFKRAMLFAPMYPRTVEGINSYDDLQIFLSLGKWDPIVPQIESERVINLFERQGAEVSTTWVVGHKINHQAKMEAKKWLNETF